MLTVAKVTASQAGGYAGYLEGRTVAPAAGDYYLKDGERVEAPGRWALGERGAAVLGVDALRAVRAEDFRAVMAVRHPSTGEPLRQVGANGEAVAAIDATFSAPKSVSAVWALASPELREAIEAAQERAVDAALAHAVEHVPMVRRRVDRATVLREKPAELIATSWRHTTARAVAGRPPDPQLHSHVTLHGAIRAGDGKVVAIESRAWLVHQREVGAAYRGELARELGRLGFEVERATGRGGRFFEIAGVPKGLIDQWSSRHHQVRDAIDARLEQRRSELREQIDAGGTSAGPATSRLATLERSGQLMPAEQRSIAMSTRAGKGELATAGDLDRSWWEAAREYGFDARAAEQLRERGPLAELGEQQLEQRIAIRLVEFDATFAPREARAVALEAGAGGSPELALAALERMHERSEVLNLADGRQTTRAHRAAERRAVASAGHLARGKAEPIDGELVDGEVARLDHILSAQGARLAGEQEQAIRTACADRRLSVIVGQAGTGKSTALAAVARAHQAAGREIVVTSTGAQAAERLAGELGQACVRAEGYSTAALEAAVRRGAVVLGPGVTVIHDEAALASTREQAWLLATAADSGARLVEVGDPRQSEAVGAGGLWPSIERAAEEHGAHVELSRIVRARDAADRRDQALWRAGEHERALGGYEARGRVVVEQTQQRAEDRALEAAHGDRQEGKSALVVVQTSNEQLDGLNARAQALRVQDGELAERGVPLTGRPYELRAGDEVVLRAPSSHPQLGPVRNGTRAEVLAVGEDRERARVRLADGREAIWSREQLDDASTRLAYVQHTFPAQGQTVDRAHVIAGEHADANGSYVALTRSRESTHLYASAERLELDRAGGRVLDDRAERPAQIGRLAEQLGSSERQVPSISIPLAHEQQAEREHARETTEREPTDRSAERIEDREQLPEREQQPQGTEHGREPGEERELWAGRARKAPESAEREPRGDELDGQIGEREQERDASGREPHADERQHAEERRKVVTDQELGKGEIKERQTDVEQDRPGQTDGRQAFAREVPVRHLAGEQPVEARDNRSHPAEPRGVDAAPASERLRWKQLDSDRADRHEQGSGVGEESQPQFSKAALAMQQTRSSPSVTQEREDLAMISENRDPTEISDMAGHHPRSQIKQKTPDSPEVRAERENPTEQHNEQPEQQNEPESRAARIMRESRERGREQERER